MLDIINTFLNDPKTTNSPLAKCMNNAYTSFKTFNTTAQTRCLSKIVFEYIEKMRQSKLNIWEKLGMINKNEIISWGAPFVWSINPDDKNPTKYKCYLEPPQLTLLDVEIYFDDKEDTQEHKKYGRISLGKDILNI